MAKYLDSEGLLYFWQKLVNKFVVKTEGKGLSSNDYTNEEKLKLESLSNYTLPAASADTLGGVKIGEGLTVSNGVISTIPVDTTPEPIVVTELPETGEKGVLYLVPNNGENPNVYDEYLYCNSQWEKVGTTEITLESITNSEIDTIVAS